ncbi:MAG: acyl-CoA thioesterase II [Caulobacteraceae bacterium]|nr:acyl-CoA thioesterase II [Caulobacteraceae bacterium]
MSDADELNRVLNLEAIELDMFRGYTDPARTHRIYGGQVVGQALNAAYRTIDGRVCNSLHAYFIRPGDPKVPILYKVERARDGGSFSIRRVIAIQHGQQIFNLAVSFQSPEEGFEHQAEAPDAPAPEGLLNEAQLREQSGEAVDPEWRWPIEVRPVNPLPRGRTEPAEPVYITWFRSVVPFGGALPDHQCVLAYASDMSLMDASLRPHGVDWTSGRLQAASLDHALWFHRPSDLCDWHLYVQESPSASGGRGFNRASIFSRDGRLVASATQEALIRWR